MDAEQLTTAHCCIPQGMWWGATGTKGIRGNSDVIGVGAPPRGRNGAEVQLGSGTRDPDAKKRHVSHLWQLARPGI